MLIFPQIKNKIEKLVPKWLNLTEDIEEIPENCIILCDESALRYHATAWNQKETKAMENIISISRHRKQTVIFIAHITRKFSITLLDIDVLICKKPGAFHNLIERTEFRKIIENVKKEFEKIPERDHKKYYYIISNKYTGLMENGLSSYWSEELSESFAGISITGEKENRIVEEEIVDEIVLPNKIESGIKIWFKKDDTQRVLEILARNSTIDGELSPLGVQCAGGNCFYSFDLKKGRDNKYYLINDRFDIEKSMKELADEKISFVVDVESAYPLTKEDVMFKIEEKKALETKNNLEEYGKRVKL